MGRLRSSVREKQQVNENPSQSESQKQRLRASLDKNPWMNQNCSQSQNLGQRIRRSQSQCPTRCVAFPLEIVTTWSGAIRKCTSIGVVLKLKLGVAHPCSARQHRA